MNVIVGALPQYGDGCKMRVRDGEKKIYVNSAVFWVVTNTTFFSQSSWASGCGRLVSALRAATRHSLRPCSEKRAPLLNEDSIIGSLEEGLHRLH